MSSATSSSKSNSSRLSSKLSSLLSLSSSSPPSWQNNNNNKSKRRRLIILIVLTIVIGSIIHTTRMLSLLYFNSSSSSSSSSDDGYYYYYDSLISPNLPIVIQQQQQQQEEEENVQGREVEEGGISIPFASSSSSSSFSSLFQEQDETSSSSSSSFIIRASSPSTKKNDASTSLSLVSSSSTSSSTTSSYFNLSVTSYIQCRLQLETYLWYQMKYWLHQDIPLLMNSYLLKVQQQQDQQQDEKNENDTHSYHYLHFYLKALDRQQYGIWKHGIWICHYNKNTNNYETDTDIKLPATKVELFVRCRGRELMVVCPTHLEEAEKAKLLTHVSVQPAIGSSSSGRRHNYHTLNNNNSTNNITTYNVQPFLRCDELARREPPPPPPRPLPSSALPPKQPRPSVLSIETTPSTSSIQLQQQQQLSSTSSLLIGACTQIVGGGSRSGRDNYDNYDYLIQWIEYHKLLGVTYFWIYINESWMNTNKFQQLLQQYYHTTQNKNTTNEYIQFVPYNYQWENHVQQHHLPLNRSTTLYHWAFFQEVQNNECLYRSKQYNIDWLLMTDVDEFIYIAQQQEEKQNNQTNPKEEEEKVKGQKDDESQDFYLRKKDRTAQTQATPPGPMLRKYLERISKNNPKIANLQLNSIPYGRNRIYNHPQSSSSLSSSSSFQTTNSTLILDYIWRNPELPETLPFVRYKNILRPNHVGFINIHYVHQITPKGYISQRQPANQIRINHYKHSEDSVYQHDYPNYNYGDTVVESSLLSPSLASSSSPPIEMDMKLIPDSSLRDQWSSLLRQSMYDNWERTFHSSTPIPSTFYKDRRKKKKMKKTTPTKH